MYDCINREYHMRVIDAFIKEVYIPTAAKVVADIVKEDMKNE